MGKLAEILEDKKQNGDSFNEVGASYGGVFQNSNGTQYIKPYDINRIKEINSDLPRYTSSVKRGQEAYRLGLSTDSYIKNGMLRGADPYNEDSWRRWLIGKGYTDDQLNDSNQFFTYTAPKRNKELFDEDTYNQAVSQRDSLWDEYDEKSATGAFSYEEMQDLFNQYTAADDEVKRLEGLRDTQGKYEGGSFYSPSYENAKKIEALNETKFEDAWANTSIVQEKDQIKAKMDAIEASDDPDWDEWSALNSQYVMMQDASNKDLKSVSDYIGSVGYANAYANEYKWQDAKELAAANPELAQQGIHQALTDRDNLLSDANFGLISALKLNQAMQKTIQNEWTDDQTSLFGTLYLTNREMAEEYATEVNQAINENKKQEELKNVTDENNSFLEDVGYWGVGRIGQIGGVGNYAMNLIEYLSTGEVQVKPYASLSEIGNAIDQKISTNLNDITGTFEFLGREIGGGDLYGIGISLMDSTIAGLVNGAGWLGTVASSAMFFGSAADSAFYEAQSLGASAGQCIIYGISSGVFECLFEEASLDKVISLSKIPAGEINAKNVMKMLGNVGISAFIEGSEEMNTSIANNLAEALILQNKSESQQQIATLMEREGLSYDEAWGKVFKQNCLDILYDGLIGSISGALHSGTVMTGDAIGNQFEYDGSELATGIDGVTFSGTSQELLDYARKYGDADLVAKIEEQWNKKQQKIDAAGPSGSNGTEKLTVEQRNQMRKEELEEKKAENAEKQWNNKQEKIDEAGPIGSNGTEKITQEQRDQMKQEERDAANAAKAEQQWNEKQEKIDDAGPIGSNGVPKLKRGQARDLAASITPQTYNKAAKAELEQKQADTEAEKVDASLKGTGTDVAQTSGFEIENDGDTVTVEGFASGEPGSITVKVSDGSTKNVSIDDVYDSLPKAFQSLIDWSRSIIGKENADMVMRSYDGSIPVSQFVTGMNQIINAVSAGGGVRSYTGQLADKLSTRAKAVAEEIGTKIWESIKNDAAKRAAAMEEANKAATDAITTGDIQEAEKQINLINQFVEENQRIASELGAELEQMDPNSAEYAEKKEDWIDRNKANQQAMEEIAKLQQQTTDARTRFKFENRKKGTISFAGGVVAGETYQPATGQLNEKQQAVVDLTRTLADFLNLDFVFYSGDAKGTQGSYVRGSRGKIFINVNAGQAAGKVLMGSTLSHELTHAIQDYSPDLYQQLKDHIVNQYLTKFGGTTFDRLVRIEMSGMKANGRSSNEMYQAAVDEVIANSCTDMLMNTQAIENLARENYSLFEEIKAHVDRIISNIKNKLSAAFQDKDEYHSAAVLGRQLDGIKEIWDRALQNAAGNMQTEKNNAAQESSVQNMAWNEQEFKDEVQEWFYSNSEQERLKSAGDFVVGTTSDVLKSLGVKDGKVLWGKSKAAKILHDHAAEGITIDVIKEIPSILEKPIIALKSNTVDGSIVLFGDIKANNGRNVMVSLTLTPGNRHGIYADFSVITSAYTRRDNNIKNLIQRSDVLYIDPSENKTRANTWLQHIGLQLPSRQSVYGSIGRVSYTNDGVNITGVTWADIIANDKEYTKNKSWTEEDLADLSYSELTDLQRQTDRQISEYDRKIREASDNPEYLDAGMAKAEADWAVKNYRRDHPGTSLFTAKNDPKFVQLKENQKAAREKYEQLTEKLGITSITEDRFNAVNLREKIMKASEAAYEREGNEKEQAAIAKSGLTEQEYFEKAAVKEFGKTTDFREAGYMLPNGTMLNFSGNKGMHTGSRGDDHRRIGIIFETTTQTAALSRFVNLGNIRIIAESPGITISDQHEPTAQQYAQLRKMIRQLGESKGCFYVDFNGTDGRDTGSYSYDTTPNADKVLADIKYFYANGTTRENNVSMYHTQFQSWEDMTEEEQQQELYRSMTMQEAKTMIEKTFVAAEIRKYYPEYRTAEQWLKDVGSDEVAMYIENDYDLQKRYINSNQHLIDYDYTISEVIDAYLEGKLVGKQKQKRIGLDLATDTGFRDERFYAQHSGIADAETYETASQRVTKANQELVNEARRNILFAAHDISILDKLNITASELNKKLRSWSNYSSVARDLSMRINNGVAPENQWTGIQNSSIINSMSVTEDDIRGMVGDIEGESTEFQRDYIARAMLAIDTHTDWTGITFEFVNGFVDDERHSVRGMYNDEERKISVGRNGYMDTVAHEMGHALDYQWCRDLFSNSNYVRNGLSDNSLSVTLLDSEDKLQFYKNFQAFIDNLCEGSVNYSKYTMDRKEVFARFVSKFVDWTQEKATGRSFSASIYQWGDKFTDNQYMEFARLLQEKSKLDVVRLSERSNGQNIQYQSWNDDQYLSAVNSGDMEAAASMVEQAAKEAGYTTGLYHGTTSRFTVFDKNFRANGKTYGNGIYLTDSRDSAKAFGKGSAETIVMDLAAKISNPFEIDLLTVSPAVREYLHKRSNAKIDMDNLRAYINGNVWNDKYMIRDHSNDTPNYDAVIVNNSYDFNGDRFKEYMVFDSNQVKSMDPVTYDDSGNVIPLSQRFDVTSDDIRYQQWAQNEDQTSLELSENELQMNKLRVENEDLKKTVADLNKTIKKMAKDAEKSGKKLKDLKWMVSRNNDPEVRLNDARKIASRLIRQFESKANTDDIANKIKAIGDYLVQHTGEDLDYDELNRQCTEVAKEIVDAAYGVMPDATGERAMYKEIAADIKGTTFYLPYDRTGELDVVDGITAFRRHNFGRFKIKIVQNDPTTMTLAWDNATMRGIDSYYKEWQSTYGTTYFPDVNTQGEMLIVFSDIFESAKDEYGNPFAQDYQEVVMGIANDLQWEAIGDTLRQMKESLPDKYSKEIAAIKAKKEQLRTEKNARIKEVREKGIWMREQALDRQRAENYKKVEALKAKYTLKERKAAERRRNTKSREKIRKLIDDLNARLKNPTEKKYVPKEFVNLTIDILEMIDTDTGKSERIAEKLAKLRTMYEGYQKSDTYKMAYDQQANEMLAALQQTIGDTPLHKMTEAQLTAVHDALRSLHHMINTAVKVRIGEIEREAYDVSRELTQETREVPGAQRKLMNKLFRKSMKFSTYLNSHLRADVLFNRLAGHKKNSTWSTIARMLDDGQLKQTEITMRLSKPFTDLINDEKGLSNFLGTTITGKIDEKKLVDIGLKDKDGIPILISHDMMIGIYLDLLNDENARHFMYGGKTIPNMEDFYAGKNDNGFGIGARRAVGISEEFSQLNKEMRQAKESDNEEEQQRIQEQIDALVSSGEHYLLEVMENIRKNMTDYDRKWLKATQQLMNVDSKAYLNETTMDVYGIEKASVENYFPITTDKNFLDSPFETITKDMNLENVGFMKQRIVSSKPTLAMGTFSVVNNQISRVAQYCGLMPAIRNFNKIFNKTAAGYSDSLKNAINETFGSAGMNYIENLMADFTGSRKESNGIFEKAIGVLRGNLAQATLTVNIRVAMSQAASYPTAAAELGFGPLMKALAKGGRSNRMISRADQDLISKYSPLLWYRMQGYSNVELGDIKNSQRLSSKVWKKFRWVTGWIQAVDGATIGRLWYASEYYIQKNNPELTVGTDSYYQAVAKKFNDVVEKTQPNYTTMQRAAILRDPSSIKKLFTMFMTQPLQNLNILYDSTAAYQRARADYSNHRNKVTEANVKEARTNMRRAVASQVVQTATYVGFKFLADALLHSLKAYRDDDDGELTAESISLQLLNNGASALMGTVLGGSELYSIIMAVTGNDKWYGLSLSGVDTIDDLINDFISVPTNWNDPEKRDKACLSFAKSLSQALGIPANNVAKIYSAFKNHIEDAMNGQFLSFEAGYERTDDQKAERLLRAMQNGDEAAAEEYRALYDSSNKAESAVAKRVKAGYVQPGGKQTISKQEAIDLLVKSGYTKRDAESTVQRWTSELVTGIAYDKIDDEYVKGNITKERAQEMLKTYGGMTTAEAKAEVLKYTCEKDTGIKYSEIKQRFLDNEIDAKQARTMLKKYGGKSVDAAEKMVTQYQFEKETEYSWSEKADALYAGAISDKKLASYVMKLNSEHSTQVKADQYVRYLHFVHDYPAYADLSESKVNRAYAIKDASGMSVDKAADMVVKADLDGNGSLKQDEVGAYLKAAGYSESEGQKIWAVFWNGKNSKTYSKWLKENK